MTRLDKEPRIIQYATDLGLEPSQRPVTQIVDYCLTKIESWLPEVSSHSTRTIGAVNLRYAALDGGASSGLAPP